MTEDSILDKAWTTMSKQPVADILEAVTSLCADENRPVHIGTDAQRHGKNMDFVTAVAVLNPGKGGRVYYCKTRLQNVHSLQHKLFTEVGLSLEIALSLCDHINAEQIEVHVDANTNMKWDSAAYHQQLAGMVVGYGFKAVLKPDAWCSSHVADHAVNCKNDTAGQRKRERRDDKKLNRRKNKK